MRQINVLNNSVFNSAFFKVFNNKGPKGLSLLGAFALWKLCDCDSAQFFSISVFTKISRTVEQVAASKRVLHAASVASAALAKLASELRY
jgi:hypothetical protein